MFKILGHVLLLSNLKEHSIKKNNHLFLLSKAHLNELEWGRSISGFLNIFQPTPCCLEKHQNTLTTGTQKFAASGRFSKHHTPLNCEIETL